MISSVQQQFDNDCLLHENDESGKATINQSRVTLFMIVNLKSG
jgi:hypothetical protein